MTASVCPKCGVSPEYGKRSCCAVGGAWYNKCGFFGDAKFNHTWSEGARACKGKQAFEYQDDTVGLR